MPRTFATYEPQTVPRARRLRDEATFPERLLGARLRARQLGVRFLRQHAVGAYVVDFCAPDARLVVEVDGSSHDGMLLQDGQRALYIAEAGYSLVRVSNHDVIQDLDGTVGRIASVLAERRPDTPSRFATAPSRGR